MIYSSLPDTEEIYIPRFLINSSKLKENLEKMFPWYDMHSDALIADLYLERHNSAKYFFIAKYFF